MGEKFTFYGTFFIFLHRFNYKSFVVACYYNSKLNLLSKVVEAQLIFSRNAIRYLTVLTSRSCFQLYIYVFLK